MHGTIVVSVVLVLLKHEYSEVWIVISSCAFCWFVKSYPPPLHSSFRFPKRAFGKTILGCELSRHSISKLGLGWHDFEKDVVFSHLCVKLLHAKKMTTKRADPSFTPKGFTYWKDVMIIFKSTHHWTVTKKQSRYQLFYLILAQTLEKCFQPSICRKRKRIDSVFWRYLPISSF